MYATFIAVCSFMILLGFEIRYRGIVEELTKLKAKAIVTDEEIVDLKKAVSMKKDAYDVYNPPK